jgi:RNA polymerase sigma-70 factor (ECF subfamily)
MAVAAPLRPLDPNRLGDHLDRLVRAARGLCRTREDVEDLVQETYVRVLSRPRLLRREDDLGYLLRALHNTFRSLKRRERLRPPGGPLHEDTEPLAGGAGDDPARALERRRVYGVVGSLPDGFREVLVAVDVAGLSYREAAAAFEIPVGTVMSRLHRARRQVERTLAASSG